MNERFESLIEHLLGNGFFLEEAIELIEKTLIARALERSRGNQTAASKALGIHRNTLQRKMAQYQLTPARQRRKAAGRETPVARKRKAG
jgi:DNA-binding NtrC family response regulator